MPPTPPGEQDQTPNRFSATSELSPGDGVWARASGHWRRARVVKVLGPVRVVVGFRLAKDVLRMRTVSVALLRRHSPASPDVIVIPAPTAAECGL